ncbi:MAG: hypothetical protein E7K72_25020, partial [Roseomonas mucosa]|nr:hypothetical protein [Roseomonas mucosa]
ALMADLIFGINIDLGGLSAMASSLPQALALSQETFPGLAEAVQLVTLGAQEHWQQYANGAPLPTGQIIRNRTGEYARSILVRETGPFSAEVYSDLPYARAIEEGTPARDMKRMLYSSWKVRRSKKGKLYLIIPFRWNHPNSVMGHNMPQEVADWWSSPKRRNSRVVSVGTRDSGQDALDIKTRKPVQTPSRKYVWGTRLTAANLQDLGITGRAQEQMAGMVRFRKPRSKGGSAHSQFLTFRNMVEDSAGWIVPAQPGKWPARTTMETIRPIAEQSFREAAEEDIRRLLGQS